MREREPAGRGARRFAVGAAVGAIIVLVVAWMVSTEQWSASEKPRVVVLYGFSTLEGAVRDGIVPAFRELWLERHGEHIEFVTTFAASGEIIDRLIARYPAEVAIVPSELDAHRLPVPWRSWRQLRHSGIIARTPVVIVVRQGNPRGIREWSDLAREGIEVVHPDPATSGLGLLALLAECGPPLVENDETRTRRLSGIWKNVVARPPSARTALHLFASGVGDALIAYEHELLSNGRRVPPETDIVYPPRTLLAEPVVSLLEKNITDRQRPLTSAFADFLLSDEAGRILEAHGFRPVSVAPGQSHPGWVEIDQALTLADFGDAAAARRQIIDGIWRKSLLSGLAQKSSP
jgi:ABC-type sulfate transport system substrate-binding protein